MDFAPNPDALVSLALGLLCLGLAAGELRKPGRWLQWLETIPGSLQDRRRWASIAVLVGGLLIALTPLFDGDWLHLWLIGLGCLFLLEAALLLILPARMMSVRAIEKHGSRPIALLLLLLGAAFGMATLLRI